MPDVWTKGITIKIPRKAHLMTAMTCAALPPVHTMQAKSWPRDSANFQHSRPAAQGRTGWIPQGQGGCADQLFTLRNIIDHHCVVP